MEGKSCPYLVTLSAWNATCLTRSTEEAQCSGGAVGSLPAEGSSREPRKACHRTSLGLYSGPDFSTEDRRFSAYSHRQAGSGRLVLSASEKLSWVLSPASESEALTTHDDAARPTQGQAAVRSRLEKDGQVIQSRDCGKMVLCELYNYRRGVLRQGRRLAQPAIRYVYEAVWALIGYQ